MGEGVFDLVDPAGIDAALDAVVEGQRQEHREMARHGFPDPWSEARYPFCTVSATCWDSGRRQRTPLTFAGASWHAEPVPHALATDALRWRVARARWVE